MYSRTEACAQVEYENFKISKITKILLLGSINGLNEICMKFKSCDVINRNLAIKVFFIIAFVVVIA